MEQVLNRLRAEQVALGKEKQFEQLRDCLMGDPDAPCHADLAAQLGMSTDAVKMAVCRLRQRYRELLRGEIAQTVNSPAEVEEKSDICSWCWRTEAGLSSRRRELALT